MQVKTKLGSVAVLVTATVTTGKEEELMLLGMRYLLNHNAPAKAFHKDTGFTTKTPYGPEVEAAVAGAIKGTLGEYFSDVDVATSLYVKTEDKVTVAVNAERQKAYNAMVKLAPDLAAEMYPECVPSVEEAASAEESNEVTE